MPIDYGPFKVILNPSGAVTLKVKAGPDPVVSCNAALFRANPAPPNYVAIRNPFWTPTKTTSNVLPPVVDVIGPSGTALLNHRLIVLLGFAVLAPSADATFRYTAQIEIIQNVAAMDIVQNQANKKSLLVELTNGDLGKWHKFAFDFT